MKIKYVVEIVILEEMNILIQLLLRAMNDLTGKIKNIKILNGNHNTLYGEINSNLSKTNYAA